MGWPSKIKSWLTRARDDAALADRVDRLLAERLRDGRSEFARALRAEAVVTALGVGEAPDGDRVIHVQPNHFTLNLTELHDRLFQDRE